MMMRMMMVMVMVLEMVLAMVMRALLSLSVTWCQYLSVREQILLQVENISLSPDIVALFFFLYTSLHTAPIFKTFFTYGEKFFSSLRSTL